MKLLALDLATHTGVAFGGPTGDPVCQTEKMGETGASHASRFAQAMRMTKRLIIAHKPNIIAIEEPIASGVAGSIDRVKLAMGYRAAVFAIAHMNQIRCVEYDVRTVRKYFIGKGNLGRDSAKITVISQCEYLGWKVQNDNEADACAVFDFARYKLGFQSSMPGRLFPK